jgi:hypothetical protein
VGFGNDVVDAGSFCGDTLASAVLAKVFVTLEDAGANDFPGPTVSAFLSAFPGLIVAPPIPSMLLTMGITISAGIIGYSRAPTVAAWAFRTGWHNYLPVC